MKFLNQLKNAKDSRQAFSEWVLMIMAAVGFAGYLEGALPGAWAVLAKLGAYFITWVAVSLAIFAIILLAALWGRPFSGHK